MMTLDTSQHSIDVLQDFANIIRSVCGHIKYWHVTPDLAIILRKGGKGRLQHFL